MTKSFLFLTILCLSIASYAQNNFEEGYYIDSDKNRITGFIKVENWNSNPKSITFKLNEMGPQQDILLKNMNGFGIGNTMQYDKYSVKISKVSDNIDTMDRTRSFELEEVTTMLKLIVDGDAQLYYYYDRGTTQYFIKKDGLITTLLYKRYLQDGSIVSNNQYKQQLSTLLQCEKEKLLDPKNLQYTNYSLEKYVTKYNACTGTLNLNYIPDEDAGFLSIKALAGLQNSSFSVDSNFNRTFDSGNQILFVPGFEIEIKLPNQTNSEWSIFIEGRYHKFETSHMYDVTTSPFVNTNSTREATVIYKAFDLGLGSRYYQGLTTNSRIFFGLNVSADIVSETAVTYTRFTNLGVDSKAPTPIVGLGIGYNWKNINIEVRYNTNRDSLIKGEIDGTSSSYSNLALTLSYSFLKVSI